MVRCGVRLGEGYQIVIMFLIGAATGLSAGEVWGGVCGVQFGVAYGREVEGAPRRGIP